MRNLSLLVIAIASLSSCKVQQQSLPAMNEPAYHTKTEANEKILVGIIQRSMLENETTFPWFKKMYDLSTPDAQAVRVFREKATAFHIVVFGGTWCEDTHNLLPGFFKLIDQSGFPADHILLIATDRAYQSAFDLSAIFHIVNVPTFIIMKDGHEVGRVVEYGKYGDITKELGEIVTGIR